MSLNLVNGSNLAQVCLRLPDLMCVLRTKLVFSVPQVTVRKSMSMSRSLDRYSTAGQLLRILKQLLSPRTQQTLTGSMQVTRRDTVTRCFHTKGWRISLQSYPVVLLLTISPEKYRIIHELSLQIWLKIFHLLAVRTAVPTIGLIKWIKPPINHKPLG